MNNAANWNVRAQPECLLGEGVTWSIERQAVLFVDIHGQRVHEYHPETEQLRSWDVPQRIGWLIAREARPGFLAGLQEGFAFVDLDSETTEAKLAWLAQPFGDQKNMRLNDAKADAHGRVWAGSLNNDDESQPVGELLRLAPDHTLHMADKGYCVPNGPAISPDGRLFLHTDSMRRTVYAFDLDGEMGTLHNKREWRVFAEHEGYPDGMNFDVEGNVWVAHWGAGCVSRFSADGDELLARFALPVSNVTNVAFGGERLDRLFVTTARAGLPESQLAQEPLAGALFEITGHDTQGLAPLAYGG